MATGANNREDQSEAPTPVLQAPGDPARDPRSQSAVDAAVAVLQSGGTVVLPTDTVYGIAALPDDSEALAMIHALKQRPDHQPLAVLVADPTQANDLVLPQTAAVKAVMAAFWPGALTLVMARRSNHRHLGLGGDPATLGVRCPASPIARAIAAGASPIATTSANRHGHPTPHDAVAAVRSMAGSVGLVIDGGPCREQPSTVVDVSAEPWRLLRAGPVPFELVLAAAGVV